MKKSILLLTLLTTPPYYAHAAEELAPTETPIISKELRDALDAAKANEPKAPEESPKKLPSLFELADANKDKQVADFEFSALSRQVFKETDLNGDGKIQPEENIVIRHVAFMKSAGFKEEEMRDPTKEELLGYEKGFEGQDLDHDGVITEYESMTNFRQMFDKADTDKNGLVSAAEYKIFMDQLQKQKQ